MANEPTPAEVLGWMARTERTAADAVDHFWPTLAGTARGRKVAQVRQWASRARRAGTPGAPSPAPTGELVALPRPAPAERDSEPPPTRPEPDYATARLDTLAFLEWQLANLLVDLQLMREAGVIREVSKLDARVSDVRQQLDMARASAGRVVNLDRTADAVALETDRRIARIRELAAKAREREL